MARTFIGGALVEDGSIERADLNTADTGKAVIRKVVAGTGIQISSTGADAGTGDVTVSTTGGMASVATDTALRAATGSDGAIINHTGRGTIFIYVASGLSVYGNDNSFDVFTTGDGGNTRWVASAGKMSRINKDSGLTVLKVQNTPVVHTVLSNFSLDLNTSDHLTVLVSGSGTMSVSEYDQRGSHEIIDLVHNGTGEEVITTPSLLWAGSSTTAPRTFYLSENLPFVRLEVTQTQDSDTPVWNIRFPYQGNFSDLAYISGILCRRYVSGEALSAAVAVVPDPSTSGRVIVADADSSTRLNVVGVTMHLVSSAGLGVWCAIPGQTVHMSGTKTMGKEVVVKTDGTLDTIDNVTFTYGQYKIVVGVITVSTAFYSSYVFMPQAPVYLDALGAP